MKGRLMKKLFILFLLFFTTDSFASGIGTTPTAPCDNATLSKYTGTVNAEINWEPNEIQLGWYDGNTKLDVPVSAQSCTYDGMITVPPQPTKPGYTFNGWKVIKVPGGFTELEYLESTAFGPYIDTGINFNSNYTYEIDYSRGGTKNMIMGARNNCSYSEKGNFSLTFCSYSCVYSSTSSGVASADFGDTVYGVKHKVKYQQSTRTLTFDGVNHWVSSWLTNIEIPHNVFLFAVNCENNRAYGSTENYARIHYYSVKNPDGTLIQNFIPARRDSDGVLGFYDSINGQFFTNQGTGAFTAGPVVQ